jgi:hypothetical protein
MIRAVIELHHYSVDMFLGLIVTLLIWHTDILYCDLPRVPTPLYPHLKKLIFPYDYDGTVDRCVDQWILVYKRFKRQPITTSTDILKNHGVVLFPPKCIRMKQV